MLKIHHLLLALAAVALVFSCQSPTNESTDTPAITEVTWQQYDSLFLLPGCTDTVNCTKYDVSYIKLSNGLPDSVMNNINKSISTLLLEVQFTSHQQVAEDFFATYNHDAAAFGGDYYPVYELRHTLEEENQMPGVLTLVHSGYVYTGGAHGMYYTAYYNFDTRSGQEIKVADLLDTTSVAFHDTARKYAQLSVPEDISPRPQYLDWYTSAEFYLPLNYQLLRQGVVFQYSVYEIASYAEGEIRFVVPMAALKPFLKPDYQYLAEGKLP